MTFRIDRRITFLSLLALQAFVGCKRKLATGQEPLASATPRPTASSAMPVVPSTTAAHQPATVPSASESRAAIKPIDRKVYNVAINQARAATRAGKYDEAYVGFERALEAWPHDPRAIAERGYARLLAEDLDQAASDLWRATRLSPNDALAAQIWFNLGLLAEKRGDDAGAKTAFARSIQLRPSGLAKRKLAARPMCGAVVARNLPSDEGWRLVKAKHWMDLYQKLYSDGRDSKAEEPPRDNDEARKSFCVRKGFERCDGESPWVLTRYLNSAFGELEDHVFVEADQSLLVLHAQVQRTTDVTMLNQFSCITEQSVEVTHPRDLVQVTVNTSHQEWSVDSPRTADCPTPRLELDDVFYDAKTTKELLRITRPGGTGAAQVELDGETIVISAGSCRATLGLRR